MLDHLLCRTPRTYHEFATAIGAAACENTLRARSAECALKRADFRSCGVWRQIGVAAFTIGAQLKHGILQLMTPPTLPGGAQLIESGMGHTAAQFGRNPSNARMRYK
jgi:hypothetical protein